ncbi:MAG: hypothetical protein ACI9JL_003885 [Paracoccaceae bacterium]|jgi:hypothetical protein
MPTTRRTKAAQLTDGEAQGQQGAFLQKTPCRETPFRGSHGQPFAVRRPDNGAAPGDEPPFFVSTSFALTVPDTIHTGW